MIGMTFKQRQATSKGPLASILFALFLITTSLLSVYILCNIVNRFSNADRKTKVVFICFKAILMIAGALLYSFINSR